MRLQANRALEPTLAVAHAAQRQSRSAGCIKGDALKKVNYDAPVGSGVRHYLPAEDPLWLPLLAHHPCNHAWRPAPDPQR